MPQTIALQRGTTTVTGSGSSSVTLFTQSGGLATRVIVNQLCMTFNGSVDSGSTVVGVYHASSGGQTSMIGLFRRVDTSGFRAIQFPVGAFTNNNWDGSSLFNDGTYYATIPTIGHTQSGGDIFSTSPSNLSVSYSTSANTRFAVLPSNFYMGPDDSIRIKAQALDGSSNPLTVTISYSFTTITET